MILDSASGKKAKSPELSEKMSYVKIVIQALLPKLPKYYATVPL